MKITLESVRAILSESLGRESFVASFIRTVEESETCPTACISSEGVLRYNPAFVAKYVNCDEDLFCLVLHEIMHPMFGHFIYKSGPLESLAADMVINASISLLFQHASGCGSLFRKTYQPHGMEGLLRPISSMHDSRYGNLYDVFYGNRHIEDRLTTGEVIQALKVLTPAYDPRAIVLIGSHTIGKSDDTAVPGLAGLPAESLCRIAENLKHAAQYPRNRTAGQGENLYELFLEAIKTHLSIRKVLLQKFATRQKVDRFKQTVHRPAIGVSPIPLHPSKRDFVLLAAGIPPFHYHNHVQRVATKEHGLAVYLDVSGSVNDHPRTQEGARLSRTCKPAPACGIEPTARNGAHTGACPMNPNSGNCQATPFTTTDLARQQYYEELLENTRKKIALLRNRSRSSNGQKIRMDILIEESVAVQAEKELKRLKDQTPILL